MTDCDLGGAGVLVTRPADQCAPLEKVIKEAGGIAYRFPGVKIVKYQQSRIRSSLAGMASVDVLIFVSPTAARIAMKLIAESGRLSGNVQFAAVGRSTASALKKAGVRDIVVPARGGGSKALLECAGLQAVNGRSILIVRGETGSETLASGLTQRGAQVSDLKCYRRILPDSDFSEIEPQLREGRISAWTATSGEIVDNLFTIAGDRGDLLRDTPLFVNHPHVAGRGYARAVRTIFVCAGEDSGFASGLGKWFSERRSS